MMVSVEGLTFHLGDAVTLGCCQAGGFNPRVSQNVIEGSVWTIDLIRFVTTVWNTIAVASRFNAPSTSTSKYCFIGVHPTSLN
jgi:hypothetical protein